MAHLTPGGVLLLFHQKFGKGLRVAWYRDVVRPRILSTAPIYDTTDSRCEIHVLTSANDWLNLVWSLKSFYEFSGRRYALCIHEDGSLDDSAVGALRHHFPSARIVRRVEADTRLAHLLRLFPRSHQFRTTNPLAPKIFDFAAFLQSDRMALFDSDLIFFSAPTAYLRRVEDPTYRYNTFNADAGNAYTVDPDAVRDLIGLELQPRVNSGLGLVHRESVNWEWIEEFLAIPGIVEGHFWRIEQTLFALCSSRHGVELLPDEYTLYLHPGIGGRPFRHYVGAIRHLMYGEGIPRLVNNGLLGRRAQYA